MLSYRHAFHAGNHADVLKHLVLIHCLQYMCQKEKAIYYIDTHAGAGLYSLVSEYALRSNEAEQGVYRLLGAKKLPDIVKTYLHLLSELNTTNQTLDRESLRLYPGSPYLASMLLRPEDKLRFFELHPTDKPLLITNAEEWNARLDRPGKRALVQGDNGLTGLRSLLPPPSRRAFVLIDPSYEMKTDYADVIKMLSDGLKRFSTGTYAVWYPLLQRTESQSFTEKLKKLCEQQGVKNWCYTSLTVKTPTPDGTGMHSSAVFVLNPPWTLNAMLQEALPFLRNALAQDQGAKYALQTSED